MPASKSKKSSAAVVAWVGDPPERCDLCKKLILKTFVDGKTKYGPWATMCLSCYHGFGVGLGTGRGQRYDKQPSGQFVKTEG